MIFCRIHQGYYLGDWREAGFVRDEYPGIFGLHTRRIVLSFTWLDTFGMMNVDASVHIDCVVTCIVLHCSRAGLLIASWNQARLRRFSSNDDLIKLLDGAGIQLPLTVLSQRVIEASLVNGDDERILLEQRGEYAYDVDAVGVQPRIRVTDLLRILLAERQVQPFVHDVQDRALAWQPFQLHPHHLALDVLDLEALQPQALNGLLDGVDDAIVPDHGLVRVAHSLLDLTNEGGLDAHRSRNSRGLATSAFLIPNVQHCHKLLMLVKELAVALVEPGPLRQRGGCLITKQASSNRSLLR